MSDDTTRLFLGLVAVLTTASLVAGILSWRSTRPLPATLDNLNARIKAWWIMVAGISAAFLFGPGGVILLFAFVSFAALREYVTLTNTRHADRWTLLGMFLIVIPVQYYLIWIDWYGLYSIFVPVYCFLAMPALTTNICSMVRGISTPTEFAAVSLAAMARSARPMRERSIFSPIQTAPNVTAQQT